MFEETHARRQVDTTTAANFLYSRIQELESALVAQKIAIEQSRQRELALHKTIEGFTALFENKQTQMQILEGRVKQLEILETAAQRQQRIAVEDADNVRQRQRAALALASGATSSSSSLAAIHHISNGSFQGSTPLLTTTGAAASGGAMGFASADSPGHASSSSPYTGGDVKEGLLQEIRQLRLQLDYKTHEANSAMIALNSLLSLPTTMASSLSSFNERDLDESAAGTGGGPETSAYRSVARLVVEALDRRRESDLEASDGAAVSMPAFASPSRGRFQSSAATTTSVVPSAHNNTSNHHRVAEGLLARENLALKEDVDRLSRILQNHHQ